MVLVLILGSLRKIMICRSRTLPFLMKSLTIANFSRCTSVSSRNSPTSHHTKKAKIVSASRPSKPKEAAFSWRIRITCPALK